MNNISVVVEQDMVKISKGNPSYDAHFSGEFADYKVANFHGFSCCLGYVSNVSRFVLFVKFFYELFLPPKQLCVIGTC